MRYYELNGEGQKQVLEYVMANGNKAVAQALLDSPAAADSWFNDVDCGENCLGHLEIGSRYSKSGNPIAATFGIECFDVIELED
jgi:hypothetical protein